MPIKTFIKNSFYYKYLSARVHRLSVKNNPRKEICRVYYMIYKKYPNLNEPKNLIEKIYWLQLNTDTTMWTKCADKYAMREYVKECGYEAYLPKNYGHWFDVDAIDFNLLPDEFVLKTNNGCGTVQIVRDKNKINAVLTKRVLKQWLKIPFGWSGAQLHYTRIAPCIIAEELLHQDDIYNKISPGSMIDFKVWCINGEPQSIFVAYNRHDAMKINIALFDTQWNSLSHFLQNTKNDVFLKDVMIPKPVCLQEILKISRKLSSPFPEVRVDFYIVEGKPVIGELTFTTGYGYFTDEYYELLGKKILLPNKK